MSGYMDVGFVRHDHTRFGCQAAGSAGMVSGYTLRDIGDFQAEAGKAKAIFTFC
jgi:hypothetical protein